MDTEHRHLLDFFNALRIGESGGKKKKVYFSTVCVVSTVTVIFRYGDT